MSELLKKFKNFIELHQLIKLNDHVLAAVSGGVDSVVLLHLLLRLIEPFKLNLQIIHLNHGLRGEQADRDLQFVKQLAEKYQLPIIARKVDTPEFVAAEGLADEEGARILRYHFFEQVLAETDANSVALGHHADDQVETVIDHFLRGSGLKGLSGMPKKRDKYIRPLLVATREEIETYAATHSLDYVIDATNKMVKYQRNRIRHELIPQLQQKFNPGISGVVLRTAQIMDEAEQYLNLQAKFALKQCVINFKKNKIILDIDSFLNYFTIIQKYIIYQILQRLQIERSLFTTEKLNRVLKLIHNRISGKRVILAPQLQVLIERDQAVFIKGEFSDFEFPIEVNKEYSLADGELWFIAKEITKAALPLNFSEAPKVEYIDANQIKGTLIIRNFRTGDRFRPLNFKGEKKISDFFTDRKIPIHKRKEVPLLICDSGIIWIMGYQIDDRFKISNRTKRILKLQIKEGKSE